MSAQHRFAHRHLHVHGSTPLHRLAPEAKVAGLLAFVMAVALTPRTWVPVFAVDVLVVATGLAIAGLGLRLVMVRLATVAPFIAFACFLPWLGDGATVDVAGIALSVDGLWAAWNIVIKATIGATASIIVTATTPIPDLLTGLSRLRVPAPIVAIVGFMFRYLDLVTDEFGRQRRAMAARGYAPRWFWQGRPLAASAGTLFVRTYERGERIHDAMMARGFDGAMPVLEDCAPRRADWVVALLPALVAVIAVAVIGMTDLFA